MAGTSRADRNGRRQAGHLVRVLLGAGGSMFFVGGAFSGHARPYAALMLVGIHGFPPEQRRLMIPIDGGHPRPGDGQRRALAVGGYTPAPGLSPVPEHRAHGSAIYAPLILEWRCARPVDPCGAGGQHDARQRSGPFDSGWRRWWPRAGRPWGGQLACGRGRGRQGGRRGSRTMVGKDRHLAVFRSPQPSGGRHSPRGIKVDAVAAMIGAGTTVWPCTTRAMIAPV